MLLLAARETTADFPVPEWILNWTCTHMLCLSSICSAENEIHSRPWNPVSGILLYLSSSFCRGIFVW